MKIDDVVRTLRYEASLLREYGHDGLGFSEVDFDKLVEALEQHHKDLMGLVEAWRIKERENHGCGDFCDGIAHGYDMCSDQLESLINPKD